METVKDQWLLEIRGKAGGKRQRTAFFRAMKPFYVILKLWRHIIIHLSKPTEHEPPRGSPAVSSGLG